MRRGLRLFFFFNLPVTFARSRFRLVRLRGTHVITTRKHDD